jgi:hypothetical protein
MLVLLQYANKIKLWDESLSVCVITYMSYAVARAGRFGGLQALQHSLFSRWLRRHSRRSQREREMVWGDVASPNPTTA